jgi:hypothetical protein
LPRSSQEIEELIRETSFEEDYAKEDIPKNEKILEFLLSYMERNHCHFFEIEYKEETKGVFLSILLLYWSQGDNIMFA